MVNKWGITPLHFVDLWSDTVVCSIEQCKGVPQVQFVLLPHMWHCLVPGYLDLERSPVEWQDYIVLFAQWPVLCLRAPAQISIRRHAGLTLYIPEFWTKLKNFAVWVLGPPPQSNLHCHLEETNCHLLPQLLVTEMGSCPFQKAVKNCSPHRWVFWLMEGLEMKLAIGNFIESVKHCKVQ